MKRYFMSKGFRVAVSVLVVLGVVIGPSVWYWDWLNGPNGTTVRNIGLVAAGVIAILLAFWRSTVAERQAETAQAGLLNERYQKGAEMLGSGVLSVRLGGIYALKRLAEEHPKEFHIQIIELFCAFVRHPTEGDSHETVAPERGNDRSDQRIRSDVYAAVKVISSLNEIVENNKLQMDLRGANLSYAGLKGANLSNAILTGANLQHAYLADADLSGAELCSTETNLKYAILTGAKLTGADLSDADLFAARLVGRTTDLSNATLIHTHLRKANLSGANLTNAHLSRTILSDALLHNTNLSNTDFWDDVYDLSQAQLDKAVSEPNLPPRLNGLLDHKTGEPLIWRGQSIGDSE